MIIETIESKSTGRVQYPWKRMNIGDSFLVIGYVRYKSILNIISDRRRRKGEFYKHTWPEYGKLLVTRVNESDLDTGKYPWLTTAVGGHFKVLMKSWHPDNPDAVTYGCIHRLCKYHEAQGHGTYWLKPSYGHWEVIRTG